MAGWCERCGQDVPVQGAPCGACWDACADAETVRSLVEYFDAATARARGLVAWVDDPKIREQPAEGVRHADPAVREASVAALDEVKAAHAAVDLLGKIDDPRAAGALRAVLGHEDRNVRKAALLSLGYSGDERDAAAIARAFDDPEWLVRQVVPIALSFAGGQVAADALFERIDEPEPGPSASLKRPAIVAALAVLDDERVFDVAREEAYGFLAPERVGNERYLEAFLFLAGPEDRERLRAAALDVMHATQIAPGDREYRRVSDAMVAVKRALARKHPEEADAFWEQVDAFVRPPRPWLASAVEDVPDVPQTVSELIPTTGLAELRPVSGGTGGRPVTKFGGQPDWIEEPAWPHASDGRPLVFYGQLVRERGDCLYVFLNWSFSTDVHNFAPLGDGNAVIVQPGPGVCQLETRAHATGPQLFERIDPPGVPPLFRRPGRMLPFERVVVTRPGAEPKEPDEDWDGPDDVWNKIGGNPYYLQGEQTPPGEGWEFAAQFSAGRAYELGDGAECYVFTRADGAGAFLWQCH